MGQDSVGHDIIRDREERKGDRDRVEALKVEAVRFYRSSSSGDGDGRWERWAFKTAARYGRAQEERGEGRGNVAVATCELRN